MPTKRNSAGQQQPYIPSGYGDASGEYAEHSMGGNRNVRFESSEESGVKTKTKKPQDIPANITEKGDQKPPETKPSETKGKSSQNIVNYVGSRSTFNNKQKQALQEICDSADESCNAVLDKALNRHEYEFSIGSGCFNAGAQTLKVNRDDFTEKEGFYKKRGEIFFHESGHLVDFSQSTRSVFERRKGLSATYISKTENATLNDIIKEEAQQFSRNKEAIDEIKNIRQQYIDKEVEKAGYSKEQADTIRNAREEAYNNHRREINELIKQEDNLLSSWYSGNITYEEYVEKRKPIVSEQNKLNDNFNNSLENKAYKEYLDKTTGAKNKAIGNFSKIYSDISDVLDGATNSRMNFGSGHSRRYWVSNPQAQGEEFFAEAFSSKAVNKESYEVLKKYFPRSIKVFEEILEEQK